VNRDVLLAMLDQLGYHADWVPDGREAVRALQSAHYDLVLMDCQMPEMDGYEATHLIRNPVTKALNPGVPIIAVTADAMTGDREKCIETGMNDYLSKPIEPSDLTRALEKWLCRAASQEAPMVPAITPAAAEEGDVFDRDALLKRLMGNRALAEKVVKTFLEGAPSQLSDLRRQSTVHDTQTARRAAHTLKGAAATVSAPAIRSLALDAEQAAVAGDWTRFEQVLPRMEDQLDRLKTAIARCDWAGGTIKTSDVSQPPCSAGP
jgi:CheY-like chemotaxis protein/HPt (histidine-containing phosphotransfer) domain-containing protein